MISLKKIICVALSAITLISCLAFVGCSKEEEVKTLDVDLTTMNEQIAYSQLCTMGQYPDPFFGGKLKVQGRLVQDEDETGKFYCAVPDGSGCCYAYVEIYFAEGETAPAYGSFIVVEGIVDSTYDDYVKDRFCGRIKDAKLISFKKPDNS